MLRATRIVRQGRWSGTAADRVSLAYDERHRRRRAMRAEGGTAFVLDLPEATVLRHGDGLLLDDGRIVAVQASPESLLQVRGRDPRHLARLAWHLGNRHLPAAIEPDRILVRPDHVIAAMLVGLGAEIAAVEAPFDPEGGAYAQEPGPGAVAAAPHPHAHPHDGSHGG